MHGTGSGIGDTEERNMKAFLLAAGYGTRLRPLTDTTPKCLIPINGKPLLTYWLELFSRHSVTDVLINTHYLREQVHDFIERHNGSGQLPHAVEFYEPELLGSCGTVAANKDFVLNEDNFFICYADNLTNIDLTAIYEFHKAHDAPLTMALFRAGNPSQCGIAAMDECNRIIKFEEKPKAPKSNLANAGIYVADKRIYSYFPDKDFIDFGKDVLPYLTGNMYGWVTRDYLLDIGTPENYKKAQEGAVWITNQK